ncbi:hypothetical protein evm_015587, partial [Chilo suppressalis]
GENIEITFLSMAEVRQPNNKEDVEVEESLSILNENNEGETSSTWTPNNLKTSVSEELRPSKLNEEDWLK